jgi:hypothetical protein
MVNDSFLKDNGGHGKNKKLCSFQTVTPSMWRWIPSFQQKKMCYLCLHNDIAVTLCRQSELEYEYTELGERPCPGQQEQCNRTVRNCHSVASKR